MNDQSISTHPLKAIASKFEIRAQRPSNQGDEKRPLGPDRQEQLPGQTACPVLSPEHIRAPALLMDNELQIVWQNDAARTQLWRLTETLGDKVAIPVLDLLLDPTFQNAVLNWKEWVAFFVRQARPLVTPQELAQLIEQRDETEREILESLLNDPQSTAASTAPANVLQLIAPDGSPDADMTFCVVATTFDKSRLLVFEQSQSEFVQPSTSKTADSQQRLAAIPRHLAGVKRVFHAFAVRLDNVATLRAEMLDEEFSRLLHRLWGDVVTTVEQYGGIVAQYAGDGLTGFFLGAENESHENPLPMIQCALKLKARMGELSREWKIRKGWLHDIQLNIGLDTGNEYLFSLQTASGEILIPAGDAVQMAVYLAQLAVGGQIWTTKRLINQVPSNDLKNIHFGIFRNGNHRQVFIAKNFSRLREITKDAVSLSDVQGDLATQPVTQIFDQTAQEEIKLSYELS